MPLRKFPEIKLKQLKKIKFNSYGSFTGRGPTKPIPEVIFYYIFKVFI